VPFEHLFQFVSGFSPASLNDGDQFCGLVAFLLTILLSRWGQMVIECGYAIF